ncbi:PTS system mannose/fructose/N-acetylgalactosamine-transporter subunit IIB [Anaerorhabdus sp.]|uniref:PTS system mannose/fructose/N-acetylgalactosamine-transporter subunit IIB n=1 Tax=Anaerorhabdus sp. TaxID=1872524 RepID=UPI002B200BC7|nr:PTS sugar transporter subunit IIB [Anaerorhabdus sp.]MEA4875147.1 PTS sugar transporter subunit IIB [Anaerorhabdus sp.]
MGKINLVRIDNRLIHGQVATNWLRNYDLNICVVVNDKVAEDELQKNLLSMAVGGFMPVRFLSVEKASEILKNADPKRKICLVLENPIDALRLIENGIQIPSINIGNLHMSDNKEKLFKTVYVDSQEKEAIKKLIDLGIEVEYRLLPGDQSVSFKTVL